MNACWSSTGSSSGVAFTSIGGDQVAPPFVAPSGSGKSSALRAGLLAALADSVLPGSEGWTLALLRPGGHPLGALERATADAAPGERLIVAVDQFEEAFATCRDESERAAFVDALVDSARDSRRRTVVLIAVRADFYGRCAAYPELSRLLGANHVLVGPMRRGELRSAIELPARRAGLRVEPELVDALVADVEGEPGALPLLSASLLELWQRRDGRTLVHAVYEQAGRVEGAVARLAEDAYQRLSPGERRRARPMLLRLAGDDEEAEAFVRRRVALDELELEHDPDAARALAVLTESRLLTVDDGAVEVAHEALLREWPRLRGWLADDAEGRRLHHHLIGASRAWRDSERDTTELYRGARLAAALDWAAEHDTELNELEREFLAESQAASEREADRQRRANRRLRILLAGVCVLLVAAVVAAVIAVSERQSAQSSARAEAAQRLGAQAVADERLDNALRLAAAGASLDDSAATRSNLLSTLLRSPAALGVLRGDGDPFLSAALSPDGGTLAVGDLDGTTRLFDTETRELIGDHQAPGPVWALAFDPRGDSLAATEGVQQLKGHLQIVDPSTARLRSSIPLGGHPAGDGLSSFTAVAYAPDGRNLVVTYSTGPIDRSKPVFMRRYDARSGAPLGKAVRIAPRSTSSPPRMSPDGRLLVSTDEATYAVNAKTLRVVREYPVGAVTAVLSADGSTVAVEGLDGGLRLLDLGSGRVRALARNQDQGLEPGAFSPDGHLLSTAAENGTVTVWDTRRGHVIETLAGHSDGVWSQAFSPDGRTLYTASDDGSMIIWDAARERRLGRPFRAGIAQGAGEAFRPGFAVSPDGRTLAVARLDGWVDFIDAETLRKTGGFEALHDRPALSIEFAPDGRRLAVAGGGGGVGIWEADSGQRLGPLLRAPQGRRPGKDRLWSDIGPRNVQALALGNEGMLAAAEAGGTVRIWDLDRRALIGPPLRLPKFVLGLAFSPEGSRLAIPFGALNAGGQSAGVEVRDMRSGEILARLRSHGQVRSVTFSPDGRLLAGGQVDGSAVFWATETWRRTGQPLALQEAPTMGVAFSPDGRTLATSHGDGTVVLWDVESQQPIGSPLPGMAAAWGLDTWVTARFAPDGRRLFVVSGAGHAIRWEIDPEAWRRQACVMAGGGLTREQWEQVVPEQDYISTCPSD
jgi:WD40 repeat protein